MTAPAYNDTTFRQQFPAFSDTAKYPQATLSFAWDLGGSWLDQNCQACWGLSGAKWQQAADLMGAVIVSQLYGVAAGSQLPGVAGISSGPIVGASNVDTSATIKIPEFGSSAFASLLLSSPPYGPLLLSLLQVAANVGPYIRSGRPSFVPP